MTIQVELLKGIVSRCEVSVPIPGRELELLLAIALRERPVSWLTLAAAIWPECDGQPARNAFNLTLHRLRKRLGVADAIKFTPYGYALGACVVTDLQELATLERALMATERPSRRQLELARIAHAKLCGVAAPASIEFSETGAALDQAVRALAQRLGARVAEASLRDGDYVSGLLVAREMLRSDPCDELACELAIRSHLARNERGAAMSEFTRYAQRLAADLGLKPTDNLKNLLAETSFRAATPLRSKAL